MLRRFSSISASRIWNVTKRNYKLDWETLRRRGRAKAKNDRSVLLQLNRTAEMKKEEGIQAIMNDAQCTREKAIEYIDAREEPYSWFPAGTDPESELETLANFAETGEFPDMILGNEYDLKRDKKLFLSNDKISTAQQEMSNADSLFLYSNPETAVERNVVEYQLALMLEAKKSIEICNYAFSYQPMADQLVNHLENNQSVNCKIIVSTHETNKKIWSSVENKRNWKPRLKTRLKVTKLEGGSTFGSQHNKLVIVDKSRVIVASANLSWVALNDSFESGFYTTNEAIVKDALAYFNAMEESAYQDILM